MGKDDDRERKRRRSRSRSRSRERDSKRDRDRSDKRDRRRSRSRSRDRDRRRDSKKDRPRDGERARDKDRKDDKASDSKESKPSTKGLSSSYADTVRASKAMAADDGDDGDGDKRSQPMDLEELVKKRDEEIAIKNKPVFLTKAQRAELAMQKRAEEVREQRSRQQQERASRTTFARAATAQSAHSQQAQYQDRHRAAEVATRELDKQKEALRVQYLGGKKKKKKILKPSEKFRFSFEWEATDDTSRDLNPLYNNRHEAQLLFGRGMRAGIDRVVQVKEGHKYLKEVQRRADIAKKEAKQAGETREERKMRHKAEDKLKASIKMKAAVVQAEKADFVNLIGQHWSEKSLEEMTDRDWRIFKEDFKIAVKGGRAPRPCRNWEESGLPDEIMVAINEAGYENPSPIQMQAIPIGLVNRDMIGLAETGSGKTAAFVLPILVYIHTTCPKMTQEIANDGPFALIMAPTRELVQQISDETVKFAKHLEFKVFSVVGGESIDEQMFRLREGVHVLIATPGRMNDCLESRLIVLQQCNYVVLDEADRMIDLGFEPQVQSILDAMPISNLKPEDEDLDDLEHKYRQTFMFSATMPPAVERLAKKFCRHPAIIQIGETGQVHDRIDQRIVICKNNQKMQKLNEALSTIANEHGMPIIVFCNTKKSCDAVSKRITTYGYSPTVLHSGKIQDLRAANIQGFRDGHYDVLVATDVAGRGIDIPNVQGVVNFDMPNKIEPYTHRIGRTGRAGKKGVAISFLTMEDTDVMFDLKSMLEKCGVEVPKELREHESAREKLGGIEQKGPKADGIFNIAPIVHRHKK